MTRPQKIRLGEVLVQQGLLSDAQLKQALEEQKITGRRLGRVFVDSRFVTEEQIAEAIARQLAVPYVNLRSFNLDRELVRKLNETAARRFRAIVLEQGAAGLRVGFADPSDLFAYDEVVKLVGGDVDVCVVAEGQLIETIDRVYQRSEEISGLADELTAELGDSAIDLGALGITPGLEDAPVVKLLQSVFESAVQVRASDIHIEPQEANLRIRYRIDGVMHVQTEADRKVATALVLRLKLMSGLDISERRLPQDGRFNIKVGNHSIDVRMSTMPTQHGESVVMRLLNQSTGLLGLDHIGMAPAMLERLRAAIHRPSGIVLVTGPTGSGKTTTLYAALAELNTPEKKIITVEDPVEYRLPGINQVQVHEKIDLSFSRVLRTALRQDPDIVLVGEMRDQETAEIGMRAAMTGHLVLSTLHTNDAVGTPIRLIDMGVPRYMVAMSLQMVVAQRLMRIVCRHCADEHTPTPQELGWLHAEGVEVAPGQRFVKGRGCSHCAGTGYQGRTGIYEMLEMTQELVDAANNPDPAVFVRAARAQMHGRNLRSDAVRLVLAGRSTLEEGLRVTSQVDER
ncbi:MAG: ATPase, T2SS/T4P/T4SS family [Rhodocyclaceae bacterium]